MSRSVQWASFAAAVVFGVLIASSGFIRLVADNPESAATAAWPALIGTVFGALGLSGIYAAHGFLLGRWAPLGFVAAMTGLALSIGQLYGLTFAAPGVGPLGPLFPLGYGPFLFGFLLLDVLLLRARQVPRMAPTLLIAGAALNAAGFATPDVRLVGVVLFGLGVTWLGLAVLLAAGRTSSIHNARAHPLAV